MCRVSNLEGQQEIDRKDLLRLMRDLVPDWDPSHLIDELEFKPILQIQQVSLRMSTQAISVIINAL